jgi:nitrite reductase (NO-forming)
MSKSILRNVRHAGLISALVIAPCLAINAGMVSAETINAPLVKAPNVPPPITRTQPATVVVNLESSEWVGPISDDNNYEFWGLNGTVPGPMIRVMVGDTVEIHLKNKKDSKQSHNIDFQTAVGPNGGAALVNAEPGKEAQIQFKVLNQGLFVYRSSIAPPSSPEHIANGMYGMILVEPVGGLKPVDKEFQIMQSEFYMKDGKKNDTLVFSNQKILDQDASYVVHNGHMTALVKIPLRSKVGETDRFFFGNAGLNFEASWHVIGEMLDRVWPGGANANKPAPLEGVQSTLVPPGEATLAEFKGEMPGTYISVDHSIFRTDKGALGLLKIDGPTNPSIFKAL